MWKVALFEIYSLWLVCIDPPPLVTTARFQLSLQPVTSLVIQSMYADNWTVLAGDRTSSKMAAVEVKNRYTSSVILSANPPCLFAITFVALVRTDRPDLAR